MWRLGCWHPDDVTLRRLQLLLSAGYVLGCAYRSALPVFDIPRQVLVDVWMSSAIVGRSVATLAELCFVAQWALLLRAASLVTGSRVGAVVARWLLPLIAVAEVFSWHAVLSTSNLGHVIEESLWGLCAALMLVAVASLWPRVDAARRPLLALCGAAAAAYALYMFGVDVPMYWSRWLADEAQGRHYFDLTQGLADASSRRPGVSRKQPARPVAPVARRSRGGAGRHAGAGRALRPAHPAGRGVQRYPAAARAARPWPGGGLRQRAHRDQRARLLRRPAFRRVNDRLAETLPDGRFVTAFIGLLDPATHRLRFLSGGQGPILHLRATQGACTVHRATRFPLGAAPLQDMRPAVDLALEPGDWLVLLSDGVFEAANAGGEQFGRARIERLLQELHAGTPAALSGRLMQAVRAHAGAAPQDDDITAVLIRRRADSRLAL